MYELYAIPSAIIFSLSSFAYTSVEPVVPPGEMEFKHIMRASQSCVDLFSNRATWHARVHIVYYCLVGLINQPSDSVENTYGKASLHNGFMLICVVDV
jgi:hypothetical protein